MFLNYLAGAVSFTLAISSFAPWMMVWFYSLKGVESFYGICVLLAGLLGVFVAIFQHLAGKIRGRSFVILALSSVSFEALYFRRLMQYGVKANEVIALVKDDVSNAILQKSQQMVGEQWTTVFSKLFLKMGMDDSVNAWDFMGGGLFLSIACSLVLLAIGLVLETLKPQME